MRIVGKIHDVTIREVADYPFLSLQFLTNSFFFHQFLWKEVSSIVAYGMLKSIGIDEMMRFVFIQYT